MNDLLERIRHRLRHHIQARVEDGGVRLYLGQCSDPECPDNMGPVTLEHGHGGGAPPSPFLRPKADHAG